MHSESFEAEVLKLQDHWEELIYEEVMKAVLSSLLCPGCEITYSTPSDTVLERASNRLREWNGDKEKRNVDINFIESTSYFCEKCFSTAGYAIANRKNRLLLSNFELQMFQCFNRHYW